MKMKDKIPSCCQPQTTEKSGFLKGILLGLIPHTFCIGFLLFSVLGVTAFSTIFRQFLAIPYFFEILVFISLLLTTFSAIFYLKRLGILSFSGARRKWRYLSILYGTTMVVNVLLLIVIFPRTVNINSFAAQTSERSEKTEIGVTIPCSGHAFLIIEELKKVSGVTGAVYNTRANFDITYDPKITTAENILEAPIFKTYPAKIIQE
jgi:hypothetical protein